MPACLDTTYFGWRARLTSSCRWNGCLYANCWIFYGVLSSIRGWILWCYGWIQLRRHLVFDYCCRIRCHPARVRILDNRCPKLGMVTYMSGHCLLYQFVRYPWLWRSGVRSFSGTCLAYYECRSEFCSLTIVQLDQNFGRGCVYYCRHIHIGWSHRRSKIRLYVLEWSRSVYSGAILYLECYRAGVTDHARHRDCWCYSCRSRQAI